MSKIEGNVGLWVAIGVSIGLAIGTAIGAGRESHKPDDKKICISSIMILPGVIVDFSMIRKAWNGLEPVS